MSIEDILKNIGAIGAENATKKETLMSLSRLDDRSLRQIIEDERKKGALICSKTGTGGGYFLASSVVDIKTYIKEQENRINSQIVALAPFKTYMRKAGENEYTI